MEKETCVNCGISGVPLYPCADGKKAVCGSYWNDFFRTSQPKGQSKGGNQS